MALKPEAKRIEESHENGRAIPRPLQTLTQHPQKVWDNIPLPSVTDPTEHDLGDGLDVGELNIMRVLGHQTRRHGQTPSSPISEKQQRIRTKKAISCAL